MIDKIIIGKNENATKTRRLGMFENDKRGYEEEKALKEKVIDTLNNNAPGIIDRKEEFIFGIEIDENDLKSSLTGTSLEFLNKVLSLEMSLALQAMLNIQVNGSNNLITMDYPNDNKLVETIKKFKNESGQVTLDLCNFIRENIRNCERYDREQLKKDVDTVVSYKYIDRYEKMKTDMITKVGVGKFGGTIKRKDGKSTLSYNVPGLFRTPELPITFITKGTDLLINALEKNRNKNK